jgi:hypothetical protein
LPIPYNINNIPTYVMTLKDDGGLVKMFAMVASDYTIVGVGNTMRETLTSFKTFTIWQIIAKINPNWCQKRQKKNVIVGSQIYSIASYK